MRFLSDIPYWTERVSAALWGGPMLFLLFGTGIFFTFRLKFIQRYTFKGIALSVKKEKGQTGDVTPFSALSTALAATVGTGNIVGVTIAISLGGPGAVFWMWLAGVFGIAVTYAESVLGVHYRVRLSKGRMAGGPMYVLEKGLSSRALGMVYAVLTSFAGLGMGCMVQANSAAVMLKYKLSVSPHITGIVLALLAGMVLLGGVKSIAAVCSRLVPFMSAFYLFSCVLLLIIGRKTLLSSTLLVLKSAFTLHAAAGGAMGGGMLLALRFGLSRGLFSNEAGMGSAAIIAAAAKTSNPVRQGLVSATATFWDTVVMCAITGLVVVNSGMWQKGLTDAALIDSVFAKIPVVGSGMLVVGLCIFVFATIIGWAYYAERAAEYAIGEKFVPVYRIIYASMAYIGSVLSLNFVWNLTDIANALMTLPNLISLFLLSPVVVSLTKRYLKESI